MEFMEVLHFMNNGVYKQKVCSVGKEGMEQEFLLYSVKHVCYCVHGWNPLTRNLP